MLLKPTVPLCPVRVRDIVVVAVDWLVVIVTFDICAVVTFPLTVISIVEPPYVVAFTVDAGVAVWGGHGVDVGVAVGVGLVVDFGDGVGVGVGVGEGEEPTAKDAKTMVSPVTS